MVAGHSIIRWNQMARPDGERDRLAVPVRRSVDGDTVEISGRALMLSRLYGGAAEPLRYPPGSAPESGSIYGFLTPDDHEVLVALYEHADATGGDLREVDALAFDLGCYRSSQRVLHWADSVGATFDGETGVPILYEFEPHEEAIAQRILTSKAIKDSAIPEDFLRNLLDPGFSPGHAVDLAYLEAVLYASSPTGADGATDPTAVLAPRPIERLAALLVAGKVPTPANVRRGRSDPVSADGFTDDAGSDDDDLFDRYASRVADAVPYLSDDLRELLGSLYAMTEQEHGSEGPHMKRVDRLVAAVAALRAADLLDRTDPPLTRLLRKRH